LDFVGYRIACSGRYRGTRRWTLRIFLRKKYGGTVRKQILDQCALQLEFAGWEAKC